MEKHTSTRSLSLSLGFGIGSRVGLFKRIVGPFRLLSRARHAVRWELHFSWNGYPFLLTVTSDNVTRIPDAMRSSTATVIHIPKHILFLSDRTLALGGPRH